MWLKVAQVKEKLHTAKEAVATAAGDITGLVEEDIGPIDTTSDVADASDEPAVEIIPDVTGTVKEKAHDAAVAITEKVALSVPVRYIYRLVSNKCYTHTEF